MAKYQLGFVIGCAALLGACAQPSQPGTARGDVRKASSPAIVGEPAKSTVLPVFTVNELVNGLIPLAPQIGDLAVRNDCIIFTMAGGAATPLWPAGSTLAYSGEVLIIHVAGGGTFKVPSAATVAGAFVPLNSTNMTKYGKPLPNRCPSAIFAVARQ